MLLPELLYLNCCSCPGCYRVINSGVCSENTNPSSTLEHLYSYNVWLFCGLYFLSAFCQERTCMPKKKLVMEGQVYTETLKAGEKARLLLVRKRNRKGKVGLLKQKVE